jgi:cell division protein FtsL
MQAARKLSQQQLRGIQNRPYRHPVYQQDPQRRVKKLKLVSLFLACFILSLVVVAQYSSLVITNYRLSNVRLELTAIQESTKQLEVEVARLSSVGVISEIARTELGMVEPELSQLRIITSGRVLSAHVGE